MTDKELDRLTALILATKDKTMTSREAGHKTGHAWYALFSSAPELIRLARRGLQAEREVCGRCKWLEDGVCARYIIERLSDDFCSRFRAKEGA